MREKILEAAAYEIEVHNSSFRMDDLAKRLNISKRTLYEHFCSKNEIIETIFIEKVGTLYGDHKRILEDKTLSCEEKLKRFFSVRSRAFTTLSGRHGREILNKMPFLIEKLQNVCEKDWKLLEDFLYEEQRKGTLKPVCIHTLILMLKGMAHQLIYDKNYDLDDITDKLREGISMILQGILVTKSEEESLK